LPNFQKLKQLGRKGRISKRGGGGQSHQFYSRWLSLIGSRFYDKHFEFLINKCSEEKAKDKHEKCTKREMTYGMYSGGGGVRCLRSYAFEGANHLLKTILFHKLTVLWNF